MPVSSSASALSSSGSALSTNGSSAMLMPPSLAGTDDLRLDCGYCANGKTLREILPPKKCDYCFKFKCQFCTLRLPLIKVRKGLPKAMKGNSRICLHCFHHMWTDHAAAGALSASSGTEAGSSSSSLTRRASFGGLTSRRGSTSSSSRGIWAANCDGDQAPSAYEDDGSLRDSMLRDSCTMEDADASLEAIDEAPAPPPPTLSQRVARALGLVIRSDTARPQDVVHVVDLWLSLFAAATLLAVVLVDQLTLQQRVAFCVVIYGGFLAVHPWIHNITLATSTPRSRASSLTRRRSSVSGTRKSVSVVEPEPERLSLEYAPSDTVPEIFQPAFRRMQERFAKCLIDPTQWKLVKTTSGGKIYDVPNDLPQPLFLIDLFVPGISIADFLDYMNRTDLKDRAVWDWNVGAFEIVDEYKNDDTSLIYNAQKSFMGGFVSARDFCLLYKRSPTTTIYASVEHPKVPERATATRGFVHLAGLHCSPSRNGEDGFHLQYMAQVDIGGSIPTRLLYNGQVDNMDKMIKSFRQAHKLFKPKRK